MVSLPRRMRKLKTKLLSIRLGSGALVLPKEVKRIHMRFGPRIEGGHMGPRKFWHNELVRLKYHNPAVSMTVDRTAKPEDPALMSIHFAQSDNTSFSATSAPNPTDSTTSSTTPEDGTTTDRVHTINMKHRTNLEILDELVRITKPYPIEPTAGDMEEMRLLGEQSVRSQRDSAQSAEVRAKVKREKELLEQARGDIAAQTGS